MKCKGSKADAEQMGLKWFIPFDICSLELQYNSAYVNRVLHKQSFSPVLLYYLDIAICVSDVYHSHL